MFRRSSSSQDGYSHLWSLFSPFLKDEIPRMRHIPRTKRQYNIVQIQEVDNPHFYMRARKKMKFGSQLFFHTSIKSCRCDPLNRTLSRAKDISEDDCICIGKTR